MNIKDKNTIIKIRLYQLLVLFFFGIINTRFITEFYNSVILSIMVFLGWMYILIEFVIFIVKERVK